MNLSLAATGISDIQALRGLESLTTLNLLNNRIQSEDERTMENDRLVKQRARESLESQIGRQQSEAKQSLMSDKREGAFKDQVTYSALFHLF